MVEDDVPDNSAEGEFGSLFRYEDDTMKEEAIINFVFLC